MRYLFLPLLFVGPAVASDPPPIKTETIRTFADGRKVVISETTIPAPVVRVRQVAVAEVDEVIVFSRPAVRVFNFVAVPGVAIVEERRGLFGNLREVKVNGKTTERYGPLGFPRR